MSLAVPDGSMQSHTWLSSGSELAMDMLPGERCCLQAEQRQAGDRFGPEMAHELSFAGSRAAVLVLGCFSAMG